MLGMLALATTAMACAAASCGGALAPLVAAFFLFETCVGMYFPLIGTLRSQYLPDAYRGVIMNLFGVPLNLLVVCVFLSIERLGLQVSSPAFPSPLSPSLALSHLLSPSSRSRGSACRVPSAARPPPSPARPSPSSCCGACWPRRRTRRRHERPAGTPVLAGEGRARAGTLAWGARVARGRRGTVAVGRVQRSPRAGCAELRGRLAMWLRPPPESRVRARRRHREPSGACPAARVRVLAEHAPRHRATPWSTHRAAVSVVGSCASRSRARVIPGHAQTQATA